MKTPRYLTYKPLDDAPAESGISREPTHIYAKFAKEADHVKLPCVSLSASYDEKKMERITWLECYLEPASHAFMLRAKRARASLVFGVENGDTRLLLRARVKSIRTPPCDVNSLAMAMYRIVVTEGPGRLVR